MIVNLTVLKTIYIYIKLNNNYKLVVIKYSEPLMFIMQLLMSVSLITVLLFTFNQNWTVLTNFSETPQHQVSWESVWHLLDCHALDIHRR
jgi:hypothetical protein